jgi:hypothetical protein
MLFKKRKGLSQSKKYSKKAREFWNVKEQEMIDEIMQYMTLPDEKLSKLSKNYSKKIGFDELFCDKEEIERFKRILRHFGEQIVIPDFVKYGTRTGFLTVVIAPALAAADGVGDIDQDVINEWLYGIGICLPVSADITDSVIDKEVLKHPLIPYNTWITCHKLGAAIIFYIGLRHIEKVKTGDETIDKRIIRRVGEGLKNVCEKQRVDYETQKKPHVSLHVIEKIYEGKICEIEATVFGTMPSKKLELVKTFEEGARYFAGELQVVDDIEDLLGDVNLGKDPTVPNPSFFLTYCIDLWNKGGENIREIMEEAMKKTKDRGEQYHSKVEEILEKLPKNFSTRPFFEMTIWYYNKVLKDKVKRFLKGDTYSDIEPKLLEILKSK